MTRTRPSSFERNRKRIMLLVFCLVHPCLPLLNAATEPDRRPNIVIILADDMGYGDIQVLNSESRIPTPNLDRLAKESAMFLDGHSPSAVCTPTRYGLLTGRYCWRTRLKKGVLGGYSRPLLETNRSTIASLLRRHGYQTGVVGKWHLGMDLPMLAEGEGDTSRWDGDPGVDFEGRIADGPLQHGFDRFFGVSASLDMAPYVYIRNDRFAALPTLQQNAVKFPHFVRKGPRSEDFIIEGVLDRLVVEAKQFIDEAVSDEAKRPFFLYLPLTAPHKPTQPHPRFRGVTSLGEYGDFVHQVDWSVGQLTDALRSRGVADNTLFVFTSDNGSYMRRQADRVAKDHTGDATQQSYLAENHRANGPFRGTKADIWEAGHHVPLFVRWTTRIPATTFVTEPVCLTDLYATCAEIVGANLGADEAEDSFSLLSLAQGEGGTRGAPVIHHSAAGMFSIRSGRWKLVLGNGSGGREQPRGRPFQQPYQLFDLSADIGEQADVASQHPEIVARLTEQCTAIREQGRSRTD